jgi:hypothetical protein
VTRTISVAKDFSKFPAGRYLSHGPFPGEKFRDDILVPALMEADRVTVELDGTMGYGSSFLEETFGGLVRSRGFSAEDLHSRLTIHSSTDPSLIREAWSYVDAARPSLSSR